jgi:hypothetical protein
MRLLVRVRSAISSMRAPAKPFCANSCVATAKISAMVRTGSFVRLGVRLGVGADFFAAGFLGAGFADFFAECTVPFIRTVYAL